MQMLEVQNLSFGYGSQKVMENISFSVNNGQVLTLLGPNGTGKTSLLKCILGLKKTLKGNILYNGINIKKFSIRERAKYFSYVPQQMMNEGFSSVSVFEFVLMGRTPYVINKITDKDEYLTMNALLHMKLEKLAFYSMNEISGGERQRAYIARALVQETPCILMDEATSNLDVQNQLVVLHMVENLAHEMNRLVIMTLHDINLASMFSDKLIMFKNHEILIQGAPNKVITKEYLKKEYNIETVIIDNSGINNAILRK